MSIEAPVKPEFSQIVGTPWTLDGHIDVGGATASLHTITVQVKAGHRYCVTVTAAGISRCETDMHRTYMIGTGGDTIATQRIGFDSGGWAGMMELPVALCGLWTATADGSADFEFLMTRDDTTADRDWELVNAKHQMFVEDLGP